VRAYLYILSVSPDPDLAEQSVPIEVDNQEIFFGPCKRRLRQLLRRDFLDEAETSCEPDEEIYLIGFNGANSRRLRKVVWAGRVKRIMTFAHADADLAGIRYARIRSGSRPPLHVQPYYDPQGRLVGYSKVGSLHSDDWAFDLISNPRVLPPEYASDLRLLVPPDGSAGKTFNRDACLLLENIFYANGVGIELDKPILDLLRKAQPTRNTDKYAIFGYQKNGTVDGRPGCWLHLEGKEAETMVSLVRDRASRLPRNMALETSQPEHRPLGTASCCTHKPKKPAKLNRATRLARCL
jgi:hypothetical protein